MKIKCDFDIDSVVPGENLSFVNPYSLFVLKKLFLTNKDIENDFFYCVDGGFLVRVFRLLYGVDLKRFSFDYSSIAGTLFEYVSLNNFRMLVVGSDEKSIRAFEKIISERHNLKNAKFINGYLNEEDYPDMGLDFSDYDFLLVGMGAGKQEVFISQARKLGFRGFGISCGGFIHQTAMAGGNYYPDWVNRFNVRWAFRIFNEPHTLKRYLKYYPKSLMGLLFERVINKGCYEFK